MTEDRLVLYPEARKLLGNVHPDTLNGWVKSGVLPPPVRLSRKTQGWALSVLQQVMRGEYRAPKA